MTFTIKRFEQMFKYKLGTLFTVLCDIVDMS